jgi:hypothetical protein
MKWPPLSRQLLNAPRKPSFSLALAVFTLELPRAFLSKWVEVITAAIKKSDPVRNLE